MKKLIYFTLACFVSIQLNAQNCETKSKELINVMQSEEMIDKMFNNMLQVMKQQSAGELSTDQQNELMTYTMNELKIITKKTIEEDYPGIYCKYLSEKEIDALIQFYSSDAGKKFLNATPDIQKDLMTKMMGEYIPEFQKKVENKKNEIKNK